MTKLLADENIPRRTVEILRGEGMDITMVSEASRGLSDSAVIEHANREGRVILTFDKDFGELIFREGKRVAGLMLLMFPPSSPEHVADRILHAISRVAPLENKVVTVREDKIRATPIRQKTENPS